MGTDRGPKHQVRATCLDMARKRCSAEVGGSQPSSAALNTMGVQRFINAKQQNAVEERKLRYQIQMAVRARRYKRLAAHLRAAPIR